MKSQALNLEPQTSEAPRELRQQSLRALKPKVQAGRAVGAGLRKSGHKVKVKKKSQNEWPKFLQFFVIWVYTFLGWDSQTLEGGFKIHHFCLGRQPYWLSWSAMETAELLEELVWVCDSCADIDVAWPVVCCVWKSHLKWAANSRTGAKDPKPSRRSGSITGGFV